MALEAQNQLKCSDLPYQCAKCHLFLTLQFYWLIEDPQIHYMHKSIGTPDLDPAGTLMTSHSKYIDINMELVSANSFQSSGKALHMVLECFWGNVCPFIHVYSFSRRFYPNRLTIGENIKRFFLKRQKDTGSAHNTKFQALFK